MQHNQPAVAREEIVILVNKNPGSEAEEKCSYNGDFEHIIANNQNEETTLPCQGDITSCLGFVCQWCIRKKKCVVGIVIFSVLIIIIIVIIIIVPPVNQEQSQPAPPLADATACPQGWIQNDKKCYLFSATEGTWDIAKNNCSSSDRALAAISSEQELAFIKQEQKKRGREYWINLRREKVEDPWKWPNGSLVSNWLPIKGEGFCGYLNENTASSTLCNNTRYWICSKPV